MEHVKHRSVFSAALIALACALALIFAPTAWAATAITPGEEAEASLDDDGLAEFSLTVDETGYYLVDPSLDVWVSIYDADGEEVTEDYFYSGSGDNIVYFEAGSYTIEVEDEWDDYEGESVSLTVEQLETQTVTVGETVELANGTVYLFTPTESVQYELTVNTTLSSTSKYFYAIAYLCSYDLEYYYGDMYTTVDTESDSDSDTVSSWLTAGETCAIIVDVCSSTMGSGSATLTITETEITDITQSDGSGSYSSTSAGTVLVSYTPTASGTYKVELAFTGDSPEGEDFYVAVWTDVYDASGECISWDELYVYAYEFVDDEDAASKESDTVTIELKAGETYYFEIYAANYESDDDVSYSLTVTAEDVECTHDYVATETVDATCTEDGYVVYTCSICGDTYTEVLDALGHDYVAVVTDPTCEEDGYTTYTCANDASHTYTVTDEGTATGHSYGEAEWVFYYTVSSDGTVTFTRGLATFTCTVCGATYQDVTTDLTVVENEDGSYTVSGTVTGPDGEAVTGTVTDTIEIETGTGTTESTDDSEDADEDEDDEESLASTGDGSSLFAGIAAAGALALAAGLAARRRRNVA